MRFREAVRSGARRLLPQGVFLEAAEAYNALRCVRALGFGQWRRLRDCFPGGSAPPGSQERFSLPCLEHPIWVRSGTSDAIELVHTVVRGTYRAHEPQAPVLRIVDAGANFGDSTTWFLSRHPKARVLAIEPDPHNFAILERNCLPYGERARPLRAALWVREASLSLVQGSSASSKSDIRVVEGSGGQTCPAIGPARAFDLLGEEIDIFKCDIEGAEAELFAHPDSANWLRRVRCAYVDVHSPVARSSVLEAAGRAGFDVLTWRELLVLRRRW